MINNRLLAHHMDGVSLSAGRHSNLKRSPSLKRGHTRSIVLTATLIILAIAGVIITFLH